MACQNSCEGCNGCVTCNSCNSCLTCVTTCNRCESSCQGSSGCLTRQTFCQACQNASEWQGRFQWNQCVSSNEFFISNSEWNRIISYINNAYGRGYGGESEPLDKDNNDFMTAKSFNDVSNALFGLGGNSSGGKQTVSTNDIIYGYYFENLEDQANNLKYKTSQCSSCNTSCNVSCDSCQSCNRCQSKNRCESNNKCTTGQTSHNCCESSTKPNE